MTPNPSAGTVEDLGPLDATGHDETDHDETDGLVAVRRNILLSAVVGALAALLGLAFVSRSAGVVDRPLGVLLLLLAALHLAALASWRVPVLVADEQGIRLRLGLSWRGLPWTSIRQVVVEHAESPLKEGRLVVVPRDLGAISEALDPLASAHLRWNRFWYDAPLSVPLGLTTFVDGHDLAADLRALGDGRVDVADLRGRQLARLEDVPPRPVAAAEPAEQPEAAEPEPTEHTELVEPVALALVDEPVLELLDEPEELPPPPEDEFELPAPVVPLRELRRSVRAEARLERPEPPAHDEEPGPADLAQPAVPGQRRPEEIAAMLAGTRVPEDTVVAEPEQPRVVIGAKIAHAREMLDMSIDELSDRTRIRPHVLEAMELDDFGPCGGDVYARGHLQSVARVLGLSVEPLMAVYDERYSQGPINARRVFEAELSTGPSSGMRATFGGPRWSLLISAVLCLTMVWGLARLFAGEPADLAAAPPGDTAVQAANQEPITSPLMVTTPMTVRASFAPAHVVVRDRTGKILWSGDLTIGQKRKVVGLAPFKVTADNGGAVVVTVKGKELGTVGEAGVEATRKFGR